MIADGRFKADDNPKLTRLPDAEVRLRLEQAYRFLLGVADAQDTEETRDEFRRLLDVAAERGLIVVLPMPDLSSARS